MTPFVSRVYHARRLPQFFTVNDFRASNRMHAYEDLRAKLNLETTDQDRIAQENMKGFIALSDEIGKWANVRLPERPTPYENWEQGQAGFMWKNLTWSYLNPYLKKVIGLSLRDRNIQSIPNEIKDLENLNFLDISKNQFTEFPKTVCALKNLRVLKASHNRISLLPKEIGQMQDLTFLNLEHNQLSTLTEVIAQCRKITTLYLKGNRFSHPPKELNDLLELKRLSLDDALVVKLPERLQKIIIK